MNFIEAKNKINDMGIDVRSFANQLAIDFNQLLGKELSCSRGGKYFPKSFMIKNFLPPYMGNPQRGPVIRYVNLKSGKEFDCQFNFFVDLVINGQITSEDVELGNRRNHARY